jgi:hypothetical protein
MEGAADVDGVGDGVGDREGVADGLGDGEGVADGLGDGEGVAVGRVVGVADGVGDGEGAVEGLPDGVTDGLAVATGVLDGSAVGTLVTAVPPPPLQPATSPASTMAKARLRRTSRWAFDFDICYSNGSTRDCVTTTAAGNPANAGTTVSRLFGIRLSRGRVKRNPSG